MVDGRKTGKCRFTVNKHRDALSNSVAGQIDILTVNCVEQYTHLTVKPKDNDVCVDDVGWKRTLSWMHENSRNKNYRTKGVWG